MIRREAGVNRLYSGFGTLFERHSGALRNEIVVHRTVRGLLCDMGLKVTEMKHRGRRTVCCGEGGMAGFANPELTKGWAAIFREASFFALFSSQWSPHQGLYGIGAMISGTLWIALSATALTLPMSLGTAFVITGLAGPLLRRMVGMIFQKPNPLPMSIARNMAFPLKLAGVRDKAIIAAKVHQALV